MKQSYFKSFYFIFTLILILFFIPSNIMLEWSKGHVSIGVVSNVFKVLEMIDNKIIDLKFKLRPDTNGHKNIVVVAIDENSLKKLGRWQSWSRENYAQTVSRLDKHGAKTIGFDIVFDSPDHNAGFKYLTQLEANYAKTKGALKDFKKALEQAKMFSNTDWMLEQASKSFNRDGKSVVFGHFIQSKKRYEKQKFKDMPNPLRVLLRSSIPFRPHDQVPIELIRTVDNFGINYKKLARSSSHHGFFSMNPDNDGVVRHYQLFHSIYENIIPSLSLKMIEKYWNSSAVIEKLNSGMLMLSMDGRIKYDLAVPSTGKVRLNFNGTQNSYKTVSLADVLDESKSIKYMYKQSVENKFEATKDEIFKDAIVLVGATAIGIFDVRNTPKQVNLAGVEVHATILDQFLNNKFFGELSDYSLFTLMILKSLILLILSYIIFKFTAISALISTVLIVFSYIWWDYNYIFLANKIVFQTPFLISVILTYLSLNSYKFFTEEKEKQFIKNTFKSYVSRDVVQQMLDDPEAIKLGGENKFISVMFTDIVGFSSVSEDLSPKDLSYILNIYLTRMTDVVFQNSGTLDKFIGDAIMCFWGAPMGLEDHAKLACKSALEMREIHTSINAQIASYGVNLQTRIGINTGDMAVGNMGSDTQFAYTCIGDAVNLSSRLEAVNKAYATTIMISEFTHKLVKDDFVFRKLDRVRVVGKQEAVIIYELVGFKGEVDTEQLEKISSFEKALELYFLGEFDLALNIFSNELHSLDKTAKVFVKRCKYLQLNQGAKDWTGIWTMDSK
jgi:adenylate cyclase